MREQLLLLQHIQTIFSLSCPSLPRLQPVKVANVGSCIRKLLFYCAYFNYGKVHHEVLGLPKRIPSFQNGQCFTNRLLIFIVNHKFRHNLVIHICSYTYEEQGDGYFVVLYVASMNTSSEPYRCKRRCCHSS